MTAIENPSAAAMAVAIGFHPYFRLLQRFAVHSSGRDVAGELPDPPISKGKGKREEQ
jgi:galactose mutarotase-like enzyme